MPNDKMRNREAIRMGLLVRERLAEAQEWQPLTTPVPDWEGCQRLVRLSEKAIKLRWFGAALRIRPQLTRAIRDLSDSLERTLSEHLHQPPPACPTLKELYAELVGLMDEFPGAEIDLRQETLSVTTDSITLEDVSLGPFRIELEFYRGGRRRLGYSIVAVDPCPAAANEEVTHPHVQNGLLCEGEGRIPIRNALQAGRLCDFFQIVAQILETYNPASAYVALDEWGGVSCVDCGRSASEDERTHCAASEETICYDCAETCANCDHNFCADFLNRCEKCGERFCIRCLEGDLCDACQKEDEQQEEVPAGTARAEAGPRGSCGEPIRVVCPEPLEVATH